MDVLRFTDTRLSPAVKYGFHGMAIDERRKDFPVTKWDARDGITQVWFVGAHCDVGGGYAPDQSYLSDVALGWMMEQLSSAGVKFAAPVPHVPQPNILGGAFHAPWAEPPFKVVGEVGQCARKVELTDMLHATVRERWNASLTPPYRPDAMGEFDGDIGNAKFDTTVYP